MAKNNKDIQKFEKRALEPPNLSVLSDNPLTDDELYSASFNLGYHLGPIYDIIRDKNQQTPITIALYGTWGTGKTTALRWLEKNIQVWNEKAKSKDKIKIRTVWFFPWKYQNKEDIYKGLLSEVILEAITVKSLDEKQITKGLRLLGGFLGRSIVDIASSLKFNLLGVEVDTKSLNEIINDFQETAHPESPYLHKLEKEFQNWVKDILGQDSRMVIFIDDLDRCLPDIALQVLEALKLYLNIKGLIFVIGIDKLVIENAVAAYLDEHHIKNVDNKMYLSKMFQVETVISPAETEVTLFMDDLLTKVHFEDKLNNKELFPLFQRLIKKYGVGNPREVKRTINNCLKAGSGAKKLEAKNA
jgi:predicted KAP-like P-loop ATPase